MRKNVAILSTLFVASLFCISSCTKKEQPDTPFTRVMGGWQKIEYATDDNNNGVIDKQEIHSQPLGFIDIMVFKSDTTGYEATSFDNSKDTSYFQWFVGGDSLYVSYKAHFSEVYYIQHVSSGNLEIITSTPTGLAWYNYAHR